YDGFRKRGNEVAAVVLVQPRTHLQDVLSIGSEQPLLYLRRIILYDVGGFDTAVPLAILHMILCDASHGLAAHRRRDNFAIAGLRQPDEGNLSVVEVGDGVIAKLRLLMLREAN